MAASDRAKAKASRTPKHIPSAAARMIFIGINFVLQSDSSKVRSNIAVGGDKSFQGGDILAKGVSTG